MVNYSMKLQFLSKTTFKFAKLAKLLILSNISQMPLLSIFVVTAYDVIINGICDTSI